MCNQAWYCCTRCQQAHWAGQQSTTTLHTAAASSAATAHSRHLPPHSLTCAVLKRFSSIKCDPGMESVIRMCLDAMALQYLKQQTGQSQLEVPQGIRTQDPCSAAPFQDRPVAQQPLAQDLPQDMPGPLAGPHQEPPHQQLQGTSLQHSPAEPCQTFEQSSDTAANSGKPVSQGLAPRSAEHHMNGLQARQLCSESTESAPASNPHRDKSTQAEACTTSQLPCMTHDDFVHLQSHASDFASKDRRDWLINLRFLRQSMQQAQWPGHIWSESALLDMVGRIASNNFGIYSTRQRLQPETQPRDVVSCQDACVPSSPQADSCQKQSTIPHKAAQQGGDGPSSAAQTQRSSCDPHNVHVSREGPELGAKTAEVQPTCEKPAFAGSAMPWPLLADRESSPAAIAEPVYALEGAPTGCNSSIDMPQQHSQQDQSSPLPEKQKQGPSTADQPGVKDTKRQQPQGEAGGKPVREDVVGREIYITASFFNHSCEPNCVKHRLLGPQSGVASVTALRDIKVSHAVWKTWSA